MISGGSFGVVYRAIDRRTGEHVAIKHACFHYPSQIRASELTSPRLTSKAVTTIFERFSKKSHSSALVTVPTLPNTRPASFEA